MDEQHEVVRPGCDAVVELLPAYVEATLPPVRRGQVEEHVAGCPDCAAALEQGRLAAAISGHLVGEDIDVTDPAAREHLLSAFRSWAGSDRAS